MRLKPIENWSIWKGLEKAERLVLVITSVVIVLAITAGVIMRYIFKTDIFGLEEIMTLVAMWLYWAGATYGSYEDSHIKADLCASFMKTEKGLKILNVTIYGISAFVLLVLSKWGVDYAISNFLSGAKTAGLGIPMIVSQIPITISFILMFIYTTYHLIRTIRPRKDQEGDEA